jgi:hypothetical protein
MSRKGFPSRRTQVVLLHLARRGKEKKNREKMMEDASKLNVRNPSSILQKLIILLEENKKKRYMGGSELMHPQDSKKGKSKFFILGQNTPPVLCAFPPVCVSVSGLLFYTLLFYYTI